MQYFKGLFIWACTSLVFAQTTNQPNTHHLTQMLTSRPLVPSAIPEAEQERLASPHYEKYKTIVTTDSGRKITVMSCGVYDYHSGTWIEVDILNCDDRYNGKQYEYHSDR